MSFLPGLPPATARLELAMRKALDMRRSQWKHEGFAYRGGADLLLRHGKFYSGRELPEDFKHLKGEPGCCFLNALAACEHDPTLHYCEGVYSIGSGMFVPHAWAVDRHGRLLEVTFPTEPEVLAGGLEHSTGLPILPIEQWGYWGAIFHHEYARAVFDVQDGAGLLDRDPHEALERPGLNREDYDEWRTDWHVLRQPYDPERRTL